LRRAVPYAVAQSLVVGFQWLSMLFLPLHFKALGVSDTGVGVLISVFSLSTLLLVLPLGILSDRLPPRPMMAAGAAVSGAAYMLAPGVQSVGWMALVVAVAGGLMLLVFRRRLRAIFMIERPEPAAIARRG